MKYFSVQKQNNNMLSARLELIYIKFTLQSTKWQKVVIFVVILMSIKYMLNLCVFETVIAETEQKQENESIAQVQSNQISAWKIAVLVTVAIVAVAAIMSLSYSNYELTELTQQTAELTQQNVELTQQAAEMKSQISTLKSDVLVLSKWCDELKKDLVSWTVSIDTAFGIMDKTVQSCNEKTNLLMSDYLTRTKK